MAEIAKSGVPSMCTIAPDDANRLAGDLFAGETLNVGDACYIKNDGTVWRTILGLVTPPAAAPTATPTGGGATGGLLAAGTYYAKYTIVNAQGETPASPESLLLTVAATNIPRFTFVGTPAAGTTYNLYLTPANGASNSEVRYATGITTATYDAAIAAPGGQPAPPTVSTASTGVTAPARVHGWCVSPAIAGDAVTLMHDVNFQYGASLTPGAPYYPSSITPGGIADVSPGGGIGPIAFAVDTTRIHVLLSRYQS